MKKKQDISNKTVAILLVVVIITTVLGTWMVLDSKLSSLPKSGDTTGNVKLSVQNGPLPISKDSGMAGIALNVK